MDELNGKPGRTHLLGIGPDLEHLELALVAHHTASHHATSHHPAAAHHSPFGGGRSKTDRPAVPDVHTDFCASGWRPFDDARRMRLRKQTAFACDRLAENSRGSCMEKV